MTLWFNKDRTIMIDLDKVISYQFYPEHTTASTVYPSSLVVNCGGGILNIGSKDAELLLDLLKKKFD